VTPVAGIGLVLGALGALMLGVKWIKARGVVGAEGARKLVHMGMGCVCLTFPWIFDEAWPVWVLVALAGGALTGLRYVPWLRARLGGVLHDVNRASWGEVYFPVGVAAVFTLSRGEVLRFVIPVALLTFADAAGALVGKRWGRHGFDTLEGRKSIEGSLAVGLTGALCVWVPLALAGMPVVTTILIALVMGLFGMILEAIAWRGLDNMFLPLAAFAQVSIYLGLSDERLMARLGVLLAVTVAAWFWRRGQLVDDSARLGGALALYFFLAVGGWVWLVAPLVLLASYTRLMPKVSGGMPRHNLVAVICVASAGLVWAVAKAMDPTGPWWWPFTLGVAAQHAVIACVRWSQARPDWSRARWWLAGTAQAAIMHSIGAWLTPERGQLGVMEWMVGGAALLAVTGVFVATERCLQMPDDLNVRWWRQGAASLLVSLAGLLVFVS